MQSGKSGGRPLLPGVCFNTLRTFMRMCENHLKETKQWSPDAEVFFHCLDHASKTKQRTWLEGLQNSIMYSLFRQHMALGNYCTHTHIHTHAHKHTHVCSCARARV